jgi:hypothetical protein
LFVCDHVRFGFMCVALLTSAFAAISFPFCVCWRLRACLVSCGFVFVLFGFGGGGWTQRTFVTAV